MISTYSLVEFPDSPGVGDVYTAANGASYQWDGVVWTGMVGGGGSPVAPPPGSGLVTVTHDTTLSGDGTAVLPLAVAPALDSGIY